MKACHVRFRGVAPTPELLRVIREHESILQEKLEPGDCCESVLLESVDGGRVRATLRLRLGATADLNVYQHASDALGAVHQAFYQAFRRAQQQQSPPSSGVRSARPGLRRTGGQQLRSAGTA